MTYNINDNTKLNLKQQKGIIMEISKRIEYMCSYCGKKTTRSETMGRPMPGKCPKKANGGPHSWKINRKY